MRLGSCGTGDASPRGLEPAPCGDRNLSKVADFRSKSDVDGRVSLVEKMRTGVAAEHEHAQTRSIPDSARTDGRGDITCKNVKDLMTYCAGLSNRF